MIFEGDTMVRKALLMMLVVLILFLGIFVSTVNVAGDTTKTDKIGPNNDVGESLFLARDGDEIDVEVTSDIPVNVYIMRSEDYKFGYDPDYSDAKLSKEQITSTEFTYEIPDERSYYLVIYNPNNITANVEYTYTDTFGDEEWLLFGFAAIVCIAIIAVVGILVLLVIIYFVFFSKKKKKKKKETLPPPPEAGLEQPPPPPGKGKKKGGKKSKKVDEDEPPEQLEFDEEPPKKKSGKKSKKKSED